jgi:putative effector of murein hydrolase
VRLRHVCATAVFLFKKTCAHVGVEQQRCEIETRLHHRCTQVCVCVCVLCVCVFFFFTRLHHHCTQVCVCVCVLCVCVCVCVLCVCVHMYYEVKNKRETLRCLLLRRKRIFFYMFMKSLLHRERENALLITTHTTAWFSLN